MIASEQVKPGRIQVLIGLETTLSDRSMFGYDPSSACYLKIPEGINERWKQLVDAIGIN